MIKKFSEKAMFFKIKNPKLILFEKIELIYYKAW